MQARVESSEGDSATKHYTDCIIIQNSLPAVKKGNKRYLDRNIIRRVRVKSKD